MGGRDEHNTVLDSGEKYDPESNTWSPIPTMLQVYTAHSLTLFFCEFSGVRVVAPLKVYEQLRIIFAVEFLSLFLSLKGFENVYLNLLLFSFVYAGQMICRSYKPCFCSHVTLKSVEYFC